VHDELGAGEAGVGWFGDQRVECLDVREAVLGLLSGGDVAVAAHDDDGDPVTVEGGQGILQPDAELADDLVRVGQLLLILVLGQVLVPEPAAPVADVPAALGVPEDLRLAGPGERLLVEGVGDHFAQGVRHRPVLQHSLDVEVELTHHAHPFGGAIAAVRSAR
jgi:hypothetical protein